MRNQANSPVIIGIIALLAVLGVVGLPFLAKVNPTVTLDVALQGYKGVLQVADTYVTACAEHTIPQSCVGPAKVVVADVDATKKAYADLKTYGNQPVPSTVAEAFTAAFSVLKDAIPAT